MFYDTIAALEKERKPETAADAAAKAYAERKSLPLV